MNRIAIAGFLVAAVVALLLSHFGFPVVIVVVGFEESLSVLHGFTLLTSE
jgi:uncharacterized membrane protein